MRIFLTNLGRYNEGQLIGKWLGLPYSELELKSTLQEIGINERYEEYFISDYESDIGLDIGEYENLDALNEVAECISNLDSYEFQTLQAAIEYEAPDISRITEIIDRLDEYNLHTDIHDDEDIGNYFLFEAGIYDLSNIGNLANYLNCEAFGRNIRLETDSDFTSLGWLERT
jgi:antirestriction protein